MSAGALSGPVFSFADIATLLLVGIAIGFAYDYEPWTIRTMIAIPFWAAIRVSWWLEK